MSNQRLDLTTPAARRALRVLDQAITILVLQTQIHNLRIADRERDAKRAEHDARLRELKAHVARLKGAMVESELLAMFTPDFDPFGFQR